MSKPFRFLPGVVAALVALSLATPANGSVIFRFTHTMGGAPKPKLRKNDPPRRRVDRSRKNENRSEANGSAASAFGQSIGLSPPSAGSRSFVPPSPPFSFPGGGASQFPGRSGGLGIDTPELLIAAAVPDEPAIPANIDDAVFEAGGDVDPPEFPISEPSIPDEPVGGDLDEPPTADTIPWEPPPSDPSFANELEDDHDPAHDMDGVDENDGVAEAEFPTFSNPEPPTWLLLAMGAMCFVVVGSWRRTSCRRRLKHCDPQAR